MEEDIKGTIERIEKKLERKADYDTGVWLAQTDIENLLTRYKEMQIRNDELNKAIGKEYELGRAQGEYEIDEAWKYTINRKLEYYNEIADEDNQEAYIKIEALKELLES